MPRVLMAHSAGTSVETARMESGLFEAYRAIAMSLENVAALDQPEVTEANTEILANLFEVYLKKTKRAYSVLRESSPWALPAPNACTRASSGRRAAPSPRC